MRRGWEFSINLAFGLLCARFVIASFWSAQSNYLNVGVLAFGGILMAVFFPRPTLFSFVVALPLLEGLTQTTLIQISALSGLMFSVIWLGWGMERAMKSLGIKRDAPTTDPRLAGAELPRPEVSPVALIVRLIASTIIASLVGQVFRHCGSPRFWTLFWKQPVFGYSDPFYFLTSSFLWLEGLFFFLFVFSEETQISPRGDSISGDKHPSLSPWASYYQAGPTWTWISTVFIVLAVTILVFLCIQFFLLFPEGWTVAGYFSPYEDISSFGSIAVAVLVFGIAKFSVRNAKTALIGATYILGMLIAVIASWSRATWLAAGVFLLLASWVRLPRKWSLAILGMIAGVVVIVNLNANHERWQKNAYLARLVSLARFENPANKDAGRINLYYKALGMIRERPLTGHLIGSFYFTSTKYGRASDPFATRPDFAHNIFLEMAAELGGPITLLFAAVCVYTLYCGFSKYFGYASWPSPPDAAGLRRPTIAPAGYRPDRLLLLGVTMALAAYLSTQMTANSLNVYVSNQFVFWFLVAVILRFPVASDANCSSEGGRA
jgi:O-antigen ligase